MTPATHNITFQTQELPQKLSQASQGIILTGYWHCKFPVDDQVSQAHSLYLVFSEGRIIFSGDQPLSWQALLETLQRYISRLRSNYTKDTILRLEQTLCLEETSPIHILSSLLKEVYTLGIINTEEVTQALRLKILSDFDTYLFEYSGQAHFQPTSQLPTLPAVLRGFELDQLLVEARKRHLLWRKLQIQIPSMKSVPVLNSEVIKHSTLSKSQKQQLESLALGNKTLDEIASALAQDSLEIATGFAALISEGLIRLKSAQDRTVPEIVIVDDSPIILKQFERLASSWGYQVKVSQNSTTALQFILSFQPVVIFLDINMPGVTGFDIVKQIRRQPKLVSTPVVMLTAEKTLSNSWRAKWGGCKFLTKPLVPNDVPQFQTDLRNLLKELAPH